MPERFEAFLRLWDLVSDGDVILTRSSRLLPVVRGGAPMILKTALVEEEKLGLRLLEHLSGSGAVPVIARSGDTVLMPRASEEHSLSAMARSGEDHAASVVLCDVIARLHGVSGQPSVDPVPLQVWFGALRRGPEGPMFELGRQVAAELLADQREVRVLHGDIHHGNVLDFGEPGWLAIDPKGLIGERTYDYANIFCNPDAEVAVQEGRFEAQVAVVSQAAALESVRLLKWVLAYTTLSASWSVGAGDDPSPALTLAELAAKALRGD